MLADNPEMFAANEDLKNGKFPSTEIVLKIIRKKIVEFLAENDRILQVQETNRNFDVLQYWSANDGKLFSCGVSDKHNNKQIIIL